MQSIVSNTPPLEISIHGFVQAISRVVHSPSLFDVIRTLAIMIDLAFCPTVLIFRWMTMQPLFVRSLGKIVKYIT